MDKSLYDKIISENINVHNKEAEFYDIIHSFGLNWYAQRILRNDMRKIIELAPGKKACDLGCGTGNVTRRLLYAGCDVTAVDLSEAMLAQLRKNLGTENSLKIFCKNIDQFLAETQERYDIITINSVLHHMPDYVDTISVALEHLSAGGVIYIIDGAHREKINKCYEFIRKCFLWLDRKFYTFIHGNKEIIYNHGIDYTYSDYHFNAAGTSGLDLCKIKDLIESRGLTLIKSSGYNIGMCLGLFAMLDDMVSVSKNCFRLLAQYRERR